MQKLCGAFVFLFWLPSSLAANEERALVAKVTYMQRFIHERRCGDDYCDGYLISAHDNTTIYALICVTDVYDGDHTYPARDKEQCRAVPLGTHLARTNDEDFYFTEYNPKVKYHVYSEEPNSQSSQGDRY
jgi:hypothetical protein